MGKGIRLCMYMLLLDTLHERCEECCSHDSYIKARKGIKLQPSGNPTSCTAIQ